MTPSVRPTIPVRYLAEMARRAATRGVSATEERRALAVAALPARALSMARLRVSEHQLARFYDALRRAAGDELFGYFERPVPPGAYATLVRLLTGARDVETALDGGRRFYRLFDRHAYWHLDVDGSRATIRLEPRDRDQASSIFFVHAMLLSPWRTLAWLAARPVVLRAVALPERFRAFAAETRYLFGRDAELDAGPPRIVLPREVLRLPVARAPEDADDYARRSLAELLAAPAASTLESELRVLLAAAAPLANLTLADSARRLGLSRAVLARKLRAAGLSFQRLKDDVRRDQAIFLLTTTSEPIARISERVGYSEPSAFQRAFREWTGVPPGRLRT